MIIIIIIIIIIVSITATYNCYCRLYYITTSVAIIKILFLFVCFPCADYECHMSMTVVIFKYSMCSITSNDAQFG
jgi:predicted transglutaminase-like protease